MAIQMIEDASGSPWRLALPLYVAFGCCAGLVQVAIPVVLQRNGLGVEQTGLLALLFLPFGLSALWAPLVDRYFSARFGRRKSWVVPCQLAIVLALLVAAFVGPQSVATLVFAMSLMAIAAATMDVALDGYLAETASNDGRATRGGIKVGGMLSGTALGSMLVLGVIDHLGWTLTLAIIAALATVAAFPFLLHTERTGTRADRAWPSPLRFLARNGNGRRMLLVALVGLALGVGPGAARLLLVERGFPPAAIGLIFGTLAALSGLAGAILGAVAGRRFGVRHALLAAASIFALTMLTFAATTHFGWQPAIPIGIIVGAASMAYGALYGALCAAAFGWTGSDQTATDYAVTQSGWNLSLVIGASLAGYCLTAFGLLAFVAVAVASLAGVWLLRRTEQGSAAKDAFGASAA